MPRDHYVPQFYLKNFALPAQAGEEPGFWVYDKDADEPRRQTPINTAVQKDFYSFKTAGDLTREIEAMLADLEARAKPVIDSWLVPIARPSEWDVRAFAHFLAFTYTRTPRQAEVAKESALIAAAELRRFLLDHPRALEISLAGYKAETGTALTLPEAQEMLRAIDDPKRFRLRANEKEAQRTSLRMTTEVARLLLDFNWCLCHAPTGTFFVTSDAPACTFVLEPDGRAIIGAGIGLPDAELTLPLSPNVCLLLDRKRRVGRMAIGQARVREFNKRTAFHAERFVIAPYRSASIAAVVAKARVTRIMPKLDAASFGASFREALADPSVMDDD